MMEVNRWGNLECFYSFFQWAVRTKYFWKMERTIDDRTGNPRLFQYL